GLADSYTLLDAAGGSVHGGTTTDTRDRASDAALLVNIGGPLPIDGIGGRARLRLLFDDDPGFTQIWATSGGDPCGVGGHHLHASVGVNIGTRRSTVPDVGVQWHALPPPVSLDHWPATDALHPERFTTVATWRSPFGTIDFGGTTYGSKAH